MYYRQSPLLGDVGIEKPVRRNPSPPRTDERGTHTYRICIMCEGLYCFITGYKESPWESSGKAEELELKKVALSGQK